MQAQISGSGRKGRAYSRVASSTGDNGSIFLADSHYLFRVIFCRVSHKTCILVFNVISLLCHILVLKRTLFNINI